MIKSRTKRTISTDAARLKLADLCSRSEQCSYDLRTKLQKWGVNTHDTEKIIDSLVSNKFLSDTRFATSFARDKVRFSAWGRNKIKLKLMQKRIDRNIISEALSSIVPADYKEAILKAAKAKARNLDLSNREDRQKLYRHLLSRGFESEPVSKLISKIRVPLSDND